MAKPEPLIRNEIRLDIIFSIIWNRRKRYILPLFLVAIGAYALICCVPRTYSVSVKLAPEYGNTGGGILSQFASMANINLGEGGHDAIVPTFYPDLMKSTDFVVPLLDVQVSTQNSPFKGTYKEYLKTQCKAPWWQKLLAAIKGKPEGADKKDDKFDPFKMTEAQMNIVDAASGSLACTVDDKTDVITITTTAQDPLVAAQLADSVSAKLQEFITEYRTHKTRGELEHVQKVMQDAYDNYIKQQKIYAAYSDSHQDVVLAEYRVKLEDLENELQMAYNAYSSAKSQEALAQAKLLSHTPAFTTLQNATVPIKPSGPKRVIFTLMMLTLSFLVITVYYVAKYKQTGDDGSRPQHNSCKEAADEELEEVQTETEDKSSQS